MRCWQDQHRQATPSRQWPEQGTATQSQCPWPHVEIRHRWQRGRGYVPILTGRLQLMNDGCKQESRMAFARVPIFYLSGRTETWRTDAAERPAHVPPAPVATCNVPTGLGASNPFMHAHVHPLPWRPDPNPFAVLPPINGGVDLHLLHHQ